MDLQEGLVIKSQSGFYTVYTADGVELVCHLRGRFKQERSDSDIVAVGDHVQFSIVEDGTGMIESIAPRTRTLGRLAPLAGGRGARRWDREGYLLEREQVIVANPDQAVFVIACAEPDPRLRMLDRLLVGAEVQRVPVIICANKLDLVDLEYAKEDFGVYEKIGYTVLYTSAETGEGVPELAAHLQGKISALMGPSGVGKSSLLNVIQPGLGLAVGQISQSTYKGRHTTVVRELFRLEQGGWVADTPGIRALALFDVDPEELDAYFPDIAPYVAGCRFSDCTHTVEPGCAVLEAVEQDEIHIHRYESYVRLRDEHQRLADMYWWGIQSD
ncbi:MAG: ribosome small subunit-dependent GTPase A [Anaerolineae bacterium]|nr:ribosome small subunit-dependent GTPase A [Anaerolineae bacterium]